jgi:lipopolysaccharide export system permease protein
MKILTKHLFWRLFFICLGSLVALSCLFLFFDLIQELSGQFATKSNLNLLMVTVLLKLPERLYELLPIAVLIGSLITFSSLSQASEYVVIRASGGSVRSFLVILGVNGITFAILAFFIGEFLVPEANRIARDFKLSQSENKIALKNFRSGYWVKDGNAFVNIGSVDSPSLLKNVSIFFFDGSYRLVSRISASSAAYKGDTDWVLKNVTEYIFFSDRIVTKRKDEFLWKTELVPDTLEFLGISKNQMSFHQLLSNVRYIKDIGQNYSALESILWSKVAHPLTIVALALLGFVAAEMQSRSRSLGLVLFLGVVSGVGVYFLNKFMFSLGSLSGWPPQIYALLPVFVIFMVTYCWVLKKEIR